MESTILNWLTKTKVYIFVNIRADCQGTSLAHLIHKESDPKNFNQTNSALASTFYVSALKQLYFLDSA